MFHFFENFFYVVQQETVSEISTFLHGEEEYNKAVAVSEALFSGKVGNLTVEEINMGFQGVQTVEVEEDLNILDALIKTGAAKSKREAREFTSGGGVLINGVQTKDLEAVISKEKAIGQQGKALVGTALGQQELTFAVLYPDKHDQMIDTTLQRVTAPLQTAC